MYTKVEIINLLFYKKEASLYGIITNKGRLDIKKSNNELSYLKLKTFLIFK